MGKGHPISKQNDNYSGPKDHERYDWGEQNP